MVEVRAGVEMVVVVTEAEGKEVGVMEAAATVAGGRVVETESVVRVVVEKVLEGSMAVERAAVAAAAAVRAAAAAVRATAPYTHIRLRIRRAELSTSRVKTPMRHTQGA